MRPWSSVRIRSGSRAPEDWPGVWYIRRGNALLSSANGHEYLLEHYLGTHSNAVAEDLAEDSVKEVVWHENVNHTPAPARVTSCDICPSSDARRLALAGDPTALCGGWSLWNGDRVPRPPENMRYDFRVGDARSM